MFRSTRVQILVALIFGLVAAILVWRYTQNMQSQVRAAQVAIAPTPIPTADVVIASVDVPSRTLLTADMVKVVQIPSELKLGTALTKPQDAIGRVTQYPLSSGEQILSGKFSVDRTIETFSLVIPPGKRAMSIVTSEVQGAGGMITPGDHIDVIAIYEPLLAGGFAANTILQNVLVLAVSQSFLDQTAPAVVVTGTPSAPGSPAVSAPISPQLQAHADARTMTLALSPQESEKLFLAEQHGTLRYLLRAVDDAATADVAGSTLTSTVPIGLQQGSSSSATPVIAPASQSTAASPLQVMNVKISPTNLRPGDVMTVEVTVKNTSNTTLQSQGPDPDFTYVQGQTYVTQNFPALPGKYRIGLNFDGQPTAPFPYRWGFGGDLGPGASTTVVGLVKMTGEVKSMTFWAGLIQEPSNVLQDSQGATLVTVSPAAILTPTAPATPPAVPSPSPAAAKTPTKAKALLTNPTSAGGVGTWL